MATVNYSTRGKKHTIVLSLSVNSKTRLRISTGFSTDQNTWEQANQKRTGNHEAQRLKSKLKELSEQVINALNDEPHPTKDWLQDQINQFKGIVVETNENSLINNTQAYIDYLPRKVISKGNFDRKGASDGTIGRYHVLKNKIEKYQNHTGRTYAVSHVNKQWINDFEKYLYEVEKLSHNTVGRYLKYVKTVCNHAKGNGLEVSSELETIRGFSVKSKVVYLTFDEIRTIESAHMESASLENVRDWLVIGCYLGQRISDLSRLTADNIKVMNGYQMVELTQEKTGKEVQIPIHPEIKYLIKKYNGFPRPISDQRFNEYVKKVCKAAGIVIPTEGGKMVKDKKTKMTRIVFGTFPKYELITSKVCRRSFATNYYGEFPTPKLMEFTGHSSEQQLRIYIGKPQEYSALELAELWDRQFSAKKKGVILLPTGTNS